MNDDCFQHQLGAAYLRMLQGYARWGGHSYYGWTEQTDPRNYLGPAIWSEADCVLRFAFELEKDFPGQVHLELPMATWTLQDYDPKLDARQYVDLVVSDFSNFVADGDAQTRFKTKRHDLFVEVKYFKKAAHGPFKFDLKKKLPSVSADIARLNRHMERGHCRHAAMLVVDDGNFWEEFCGDVEFGEVLDLTVSPHRVANLASLGRAEQRMSSNPFKEWEYLGRMPIAKVTPEVTEFIGRLWQSLDATEQQALSDATKFVGPFGPSSFSEWSETSQEDAARLLPVVKQKAVSIDPSVRLFSDGEPPEKPYEMTNEMREAVIVRWLRDHPR